MMKLLLWLLQALPEAWTDDTHPENESVSAVVIPALILLVLVPTMLYQADVTWWKSVLAESGIYLCFGMIYLSVRR